MSRDFDTFSHDGCCVPHHIRSGIRAYVDHHRAPGKFLGYVICNDLRNALFHADRTNRENLIAIVSYFHNETPADCWGSKEAMEAWVARGLEQGTQTGQEV